MVHNAIKPFNLALSEDEITELQSYLGEILRSGELILGRFTEEFENEFARYIGCRYAVSLSSGTSALETLLRIHGVEGKKVAVPTNTNFATPAAIVRAGGKPVFLDMIPETSAGQNLTAKSICLRALPEKFGNHPTLRRGQLGRRPCMGTRAILPGRTLAHWLTTGLPRDKKRPMR
jgi:dTDP-4-amino-4,6-dideoxygalactose transaminase